MLLVSICSTLAGQLDAPPMGISTMIPRGQKVNQSYVQGVMASLEARGLKAAGYDVILLDDGWQSSVRDASGKLYLDESRFPNQMRDLAAAVHAAGFKLGLSVSATEKTCRYGHPGAYGHEDQDALLLSQLGVDHLKLELCGDSSVYKHTEAPDVGNITVGERLYRVSDAEILDGAELRPNGFVTGLTATSGQVRFFVDAESAGPHLASVRYLDAAGGRILRVRVNDGPAQQLAAINRTASGDRAADSLLLYFTVELRAGQNTVVLSNGNGLADNILYYYGRMTSALRLLNHTGYTLHACDWGLNRPQEWAPAVAGLWRTVTDPAADLFGSFSFSHVVAAFEANAALDAYATAHGYNDPGVLLANAKGVSLAQARSQFSLWCVMGAPLFIGNDVSGLSDEEVQMLTNPRALEVDRDVSRQPQGARYYTDGTRDYVVKALRGNRAAVAAFNRGGRALDYSVQLRNLARFANLEDKEAWRNAPEFACENVWTGERLSADALGGSLGAHETAFWVCE